jgi:hypothetical protein
MASARHDSSCVTCDDIDRVRTRPRDIRLALCALSRPRDHHRGACFARAGALPRSAKLK